MWSQKAQTGQTELVEQQRRHQGVSERSATVSRSYIVIPGQPGSVRESQNQSEHDQVSKTKWRRLADKF